MLNKQRPRLFWSLLGENNESDCAYPETLSFCGIWLKDSTAASDCACAPEVIALGLPPSCTNALWQIPPSLYRAPLPEGHTLLFNTQGAATVAVLNAAAQQRFAHFTEPRPLKTETDEQFAALGLLSSDCGPGEHLHAPPQLLTVWLHVTDACNLRCPYCYVRKRGREMDVATGRAAIKAVVRSAEAHGFRAVKLKYAGGEPTLRWPLVSTLHAYARTLTDHRGLGLHATLLSNGTRLTDAMIAWLQDQNVRLMISLDGVGAPHDAQRPFSDGRGSFAQVAGTIDRALDRGLAPYLSITVTEHNIDHLGEVVAFALERDLRFNLNFVRDPERISRLAEPHAQQRWIAGLQNALSTIEANLPRERFIDGLLDRSLFSSPHAYPCGAGRSYLVIGPQGNVSRCQMRMDDTVSTVKNDDPLDAIRAADANFQNVPVDDKLQCHTCPWRYWCAGGCPLLARSVQARPGPSPYCAIYRALFPALLRLEGLRLLRWCH
ncbi:MAG: radical SAM protein [Anaerolineae bacterium]